MALFKGFSTINKLFPPYRLTDIDLVKRDLLNHFTTRRGERVMNPEFGTIIFDLLMDPQDPLTRQLIIDDAKRVVRSDPRVSLVSTKIQEVDQAIVIAIELIYVPSNITDTLYVQYKFNIQGDQ